MNKDFIKYIEKEIYNKTGEKTNYISHHSISGGCINNSFKLITTTRKFFIKTNNASLYPNMFKAESMGLSLLSSKSSLKIPNVICFGDFNNNSFLILEFIEETSKTKDYWINFAIGLAKQHENSTKTFGLDYNNYIGSLTQSNKQNNSWIDFFIEQRLNPLISKSYEKKLVDLNFIKRFEKLFNILENIIPFEKPSLLHGDLWSGNVIVDNTGEACLIDPAVYYGHREVDIAFSNLFGAFPNEFYNTYNDCFALEKNWQKRIDLFNLYPLLVHLVLFGSSYYSQIDMILKKYS